ncbi:hypothetical protein D3C85_1691020 [compost metagenome]
MLSCRPTSFKVCGAFATTWAWPSMMAIELKLSVWRNRRSVSAARKAGLLKSLAITPAAYSSCCMTSSKKSSVLAASLVAYAWLLSSAASISCWRCTW